MNTTTKTIMIAGTAALFALVSEVGAAEAAKRYNNDGGMHRQHNSAQKFNGNRRMGMKHRNRRQGIGIGGVYLSLGAGSSCSYSYRRWQATGSQYWRARYSACVNG